MCSNQFREFPSCFYYDATTSSMPQTTKNRGKSKNIDWKYCFICQNKRSPPNNTTEESLKTLCGNLTKIWELGELDLEWESMAIVMNEDGKPDLFASVKDKARFHRKCTNMTNKRSNEFLQRGIQIKTC